MNSTLEIDFFCQISPINRGTLGIIGVFTLVLFIFSFISNSTLLVIYLKNKSLFKSINMVIVILAAFNLIGTVFTLPLVTVNSFMGRFVFGKYGCYISSFIMYFVGCFSIYLLVIISFFRYVYFLIFI